VRAVFLLFSARKIEVVVENAILQKENEILKRKKKDRLKFRFFDRLFYSVMCKLSERAKEYVTLIKPDTVLKWQRNLIKKFWTFPSERPRIGRPPIPALIKELILDMKNKNIYWGYKRIQGELLKLGIEFDLLKEADVVLEIFNLAGQRIEMLVNKYLEAGHYNVNWDASQMPSGIYFYKIRAGSFIDMKKMILVK
jgi:hypothetical protein